MRIRLLILAALFPLALTLAMGCAQLAGRGHEGPSLAITVKPVRAGQAEVQYVEFRQRLVLPPDSDKPLDLRSPITYAGRTGIADRVKDLTVTDANGPVPMKVEDDPVNPGGFPFYRHWRAERAVSGPISVSYRMMSFTGTATPGPQFDFYSHGGGISTGGMAFFVLPQNIPAADLSVKWDLSDLAKGSTAASTYGAGDIKLKAAPEQLAQAYYLAGPIGHHAKSKDADFNAYWLGKPAFDPKKELAWVADAYDYMRDFWKDPKAGKYTAFIRALPGTGGGTGLQNSFMTGVAPGTEDPAKTGPRGTLFHEIGHMFIGDVSSGQNSGTAWFAEGLNVHYTRLLMLRSGMAPVEDYVRDINGSATSYYSNAYRNTSAAELSRIGFSSGIGAGSAQNVAYTRGSLYFADIDAKIRAKSNGARTLDDIIKPLFARRSAGEAITPTILVDAFVAEIGPAARDEFEAVIIRGETITPDANAFGPCLDRRPKTYAVNGGGESQGYEWIRKSDVPDEVCRKW